MKATNYVDLKEEAIKEAIRLYLIKAGRDVASVEISNVGVSPLAIGVTINEDVVNASEKNQVFVVTPKNKVRMVRSVAQPITIKPHDQFENKRK